MTDGFTAVHRSILRAIAPQSVNPLHLMIRAIFFHFRNVKHDGMVCSRERLPVVCVKLDAALSRLRSTHPWI
jgi:hypothetical protein